MAFGFTRETAGAALQLRSTTEPVEPAQELTFMQSYVDPRRMATVTVMPQEEEPPSGRLTVGPRTSAPSTPAIDFKYVPGATNIVDAVPGGGAKTGPIVDAVPSSGKQNGYITPQGQPLTAAQCAQMGGVLGSDGKCYAKPKDEGMSTLSMPLLIGGALVLFLLLRK